MNINFSFLPEQLKKATEEIILQIGIKSSSDGIILTAEKGEMLSVVCDGKTIKITYPTLNQYFRALAIVAMKGKGVYKVQEKALIAELGIMLDCSRNAVATISHIKNLIRYLALMGYNQLQIYTEDTFEVEGEPYFGYQRGRYTLAEMREIDDYACSYGIEIVPCIQTLAHLKCIFKWPEYSQICDIDDILLVDEKRTEQLIDNMFKTLSKAYRSRKINIGMDEAPMIGRGQYQDKHGVVKDKSVLLFNHLNKVVSIARKYGYEPMMWCDMFFRLALNGCYFANGEKVLLPKQIIKSVPDNIRLIYWDYSHENKDDYIKMIDAILPCKRKVIFAGGAWNWKGFAPMNRFSLTCLKSAINACFEKGIDNILITTWGDDGAECSVLAVLPTFCYVANRAYGHESCEELFKTITGINFNDFTALDLANEIYDPKDSGYINPCRFGLYADPIGSWMDFLLVKGVDKKYAQYAERLKEIEEKAGKYDYLFRTQRTLCEVLSLKSDLGLRVRDAYANADKNALKRLVEERFYPLLKLVEEFYKAFKAQWNKEYKWIGFETQDYRLGGLMKRLEHDAEMLLEYVEGKTDKIVQLEEPLLEPYVDKSKVGDFYSVSNYITCGLF